MTSVICIMDTDFYCSQYWVDCDNQIMVRLEAKGILLRPSGKLEHLGSTLCMGCSSYLLFVWKCSLSLPLAPHSAFGLIHMDFWLCIYNLSSLGRNAFCLPFSKSYPPFYQHPCYDLGVVYPPEGFCHGDMVLSLEMLGRDGAGKQWSWWSLDLWGRDCRRL